MSTEKIDMEQLAAALEDHKAAKQNQSPMQKMAGVLAKGDQSTTSAALMALNLAQQDVCAALAKAGVPDTLHAFARDTGILPVFAGAKLGDQDILADVVNDLNVTLSADEKDLRPRDAFFLAKAAAVIEMAKHPSVRAQLVKSDEKLWTEIAGLDIGPLAKVAADLAGDIRPLKKDGGSVRDPNALRMGLAKGEVELSEIDPDQLSDEEIDRLEAMLEAAEDAEAEALDPEIAALYEHEINPSYEAAIEDAAAAIEGLPEDEQEAEIANMVEGIEAYQEAAAKAEMGPIDADLALVKAVLPAYAAALRGDADTLIKRAQADEKACAAVLKVGDVLSKSDKIDDTAAKVIDENAAEVLFAWGRALAKGALTKREESLLEKKVSFAGLRSAAGRAGEYLRTALGGAYGRASGVAGNAYGRASGVAGAAGAGALRRLRQAKSMMRYNPQAAGVIAGGGALAGGLAGYGAGRMRRRSV